MNKINLPFDFHQSVNVYTFDPGVNTGWARWMGGNLVGVGTLKGENIGIGVKVSLFKINHAIIEGVDYRPSNAASMAAAGRGDLSELSYRVGVLQMAAEIAQAKTITICLYREWAGQLSYKQLRFILKEKFGITVKNDHIASAVGIGLWARGDL